MGARVKPAHDEPKVVGLHQRPAVFHQLTPPCGHRPDLLGGVERRGPKHTVTARIADALSVPFGVITASSAWRKCYIDERRVGPSDHMR